MHLQAMKVLACNQSVSIITLEADNLSQITDGCLGSLTLYLGFSIRKMKVINTASQDCYKSRVWHIVGI